MRYSARPVSVPLCLLILIAVLLCAGCSSKQRAAPAKPVNPGEQVFQTFSPEALDRYAKTQYKYGKHGEYTRDIRTLASKRSIGSATYRLTTKKASPIHAYSTAFMCKPKSREITVSAVDSHGTHMIGKATCEAWSFQAFDFNVSQYPTVSAITITTAKDVQTIWTIHEVDHL